MEFIRMPNSLQILFVLIVTDTLGFQLQKAGFLSAAPYLAMGILLSVSGYLADMCQVKGYLTTSQVRRYFNCGGFLAQTIFMMLAAYLLNPIASIMCIVIAVGLGAFAWCGFAVNHLDIAPQHASVLMGISNTFATVPGIVSPALTGYIVQTSVCNLRIHFCRSTIFMFDSIIFRVSVNGEQCSLFRQ